MKDDTTSPLQTGVTGALSNVVCPFCALVCDDLSLPLNNGQIQPGQLGCPQAGEGFRLALESGEARPSHRGQAIDWDEALARAGEQLREARRPLFHGLLGDLQDARAAWRLAAHFRGVVDHRDGAAMARTLRVFQDTGWQVASLGEIRNRADLVLRIGDIELPRLQEKLFETDGRLHRDRPAEVLDLQGDSLAVLEQLRILRRGGPLNPGGNEALAQAQALHRRLGEAAFPVFLLGRLPDQAVELVLRATVALVREINETGRAALLPLGSGAGDITAQSSGAWHNGFGIRTDFSAGYPRQDLHAHAAARLLASGEADLSLWFSSLSDAPPPACEQPSIVFGHPGMRFEQAPELYLPVGVPGVHRKGFLHRADGVRMLPLGDIRPSTLPSSRELAERLIAANPEDATC